MVHLAVTFKRLDTHTREPNHSMTVETIAHMKQQKRLKTNSKIAEWEKVYQFERLAHIPAQADAEGKVTIDLKNQRFIFRNIGPSYTLHIYISAHTVPYGTAVINMEDIVNGGSFNFPVDSDAVPGKVGNISIEVSPYVARYERAKKSERLIWEEFEENIRYDRTHPPPQGNRYRKQGAVAVQPKAVPQVEAPKIEEKTPEPPKVVETPAKEPEPEKVSAAVQTPIPSQPAVIDPDQYRNQMMALNADINTAITSVDEMLRPIPMVPMGSPRLVPGGEYFPPY